MRRFLLATALLLYSALYLNISAQSFSALNNVSLTGGVTFAKSAWADYDNDGDLDFISIGLDGNSTPVTALYKNTSGTFAVQSTPELPNVYNAFVSWGDYDSDGRLDLVIAGETVFNSNTSSITKVFKNTPTGFQEQFSGLFPPINSGDARWLDYNNDGHLDLVITGTSITSDGNSGLNQVFISKLFKNTGSTFVEVFANGFQGLGYSSVDAADFNADGLVDIIFSGSRSGGMAPLERTKIYQNSGTSFSEVFIDQISGISFGDAKWWDFDLDGDMDVVVEGANDGVRNGKVFRNNGTSFTEVFIDVLPKLSSSSIDIGDFDMDGDDDLVVSGNTGSGLVTTIFRNDNTSLSEVFAGAVSGLHQGTVSWGDSDGDGDLDILARGLGDNNIAVSQIFLNDGQTNSFTANTKPSPPSVLSQTYVNNVSTLSWNAGSDTETPAAGLTYNFYIRSLNDTIITSQSLANGKRKIIKSGNRAHAKSILLQSFPRGKYYWTVQSVDNNFQGSAFAPESIFNVNVVPVVTASRQRKIGSNSPYTLLLSDLTVVDSDGQYPTGYSISVADGANYTRSGNQITPVPGFAGNLSVPATVNDGLDDSAPFNVIITVNAKPVISAAAQFNTAAHSPLTISLNDLTVTDTDGQYPTGYTLSVKDGSNYIRNGNSITPVSGFAGNLPVQVTVDDGLDVSVPFNVIVAVAPNIKPVITAAKSFKISAQSSLTFSLGDLTVTDSDGQYPTGYTLAVKDGFNYTRNGNKITPVPGFSGSLSVPVSVNDGLDDSELFNITVGVNVKPAIMAAKSFKIAAQSSLTFSLGDFTVTDSDGQYPTGYTLAVKDGPNYTRNGNRITPVSGFAGNFSVPVIVNDGMDDSEVFNVTVGVNVKPVITSAKSFSLPGRNALTILLSDLNLVDSDGNYPTDYTLFVKDGSNYTRNGNEIKPTSGFRGILSVPVTVNDGLDDSEPFTVKVAVNITPVITAAKAFKVASNSPLTILLSDLTVSDPDGIYPTGYTITVKDGSNYTRNGNQITPVSGYGGNLTVPVIVNDGMDNSETFNLTVAVNFKPVIVEVNPLTIGSSGKLTISLNDLTVTDPDGQFPTGYTLSVKDGANYTRNGNEIKVANNFRGSLVIPVTVNDGYDESNSFVITIVVQVITAIEPSSFIEKATISPNPFRDKIIFTSKGLSDQATVSIHSLTGQSIDFRLSKTSGDTLEILDLDSLAPGVYMITINNGTSIEVKKVVKIN
jgi:hypothetical protein